MAQWHSYPQTLLLSIAVATGCHPILPRQPLTPPPEATKQGFTILTFYTDKFSEKNTDLSSKSLSEKTKWYAWNFFHHHNSSGIFFNKDQSISLRSQNYNGSIATATRVGNRMIGQAFGGGGYFEADISFNPKAVDLKQGWPAWWAVTWESLGNQPGAFWKRQTPGFFNTSEVDFFEYLEAFNPMGNRFGAGMHHWYGRKGDCKGRGLCGYAPPRSITVRSAPLGIDWQQPHLIGGLWTTATHGKPGTMTFFLDRKQVGETIKWSEFEDQPPPPSKNTPWAQGIIDRQHLVLILGAGKNTPIIVRSIRVWQHDNSQNILQK